MRVGSKTILFARLHRGCTLRLVAGALICFSLLGLLQSALMPCSIVFSWHSESWDIDGGVGTDHLVLRAGLYIKRTEHGVPEKWWVVQRTEFRFFHVRQLLPVLKLSSPDPIRPDLSIAIHVPYILTFIVGVALAWLCRIMRTRRQRGFSIVAEHSRDADGADVGR